MPGEKENPDLFAQPEKSERQRHVYTVSAITQDIKLILESNFSGIWVEGEVSNFRPSAAGHCYFSLKDEFAILQAAIFNRTARAIKFKIEDGLKFICFGNIEVYGPHGKYQLIIEKIEPKGVGSLQLALEQLKRKLEKEGLFSPAHKKPVPQLPARIGVVTSSQGAAIKDILKVLERRFKDVHIVINPVRVQGEGAKDEIARAIEDFNAFNLQANPAERIDVMIVGRGGGSIEDLWAFNEETVARALYNSKIPTISAVGHERDWTIADLVADLRAATPSVAAELVIPNKDDLKNRLHGLTQDLKKALSDTAFTLQETLDDLAYRLTLGMGHVREISAGSFSAAYKKLVLLNPVSRLKRYQEKISDFINQIYLRMDHVLKLRQAVLAKAAEKLSGLSPLNILARGYSIAFKIPEGVIVKDAAMVAAGDVIKTRLHKGEILSRVTEVNKNGGNKI